MKVGFIGGGKMAEAIAASLLRAGLCKAQEIFACDISASRRRLLKRRYAVNVSADARRVLDEVSTVFLAVKPQDLSVALGGLASHFKGRHLVISIAAGKRLAWIEAYLKPSRVIRVMPNMGSLVSQGMSVYCAGSRATAADRRQACRLLSAFGQVMTLPEAQFDVVTALSGSGPAFLAYLLDRLADEGEAQGLSRRDALRLLQQTMLGTARLLMEQGMTPADLVASVASPKGTTAAGLAVLAGSDVADVLRRTVRAAARRSQELSAI